VQQEYRVVETDETLFNAVEDTGTGEVLRVWEADCPAVVLGRFGKAAAEIHQTVCAADNIPILRRISGGGAVVVGPGCLNYSMVLSFETRPELRDVSRSFRLVLTWVISALGLDGLTIEGLSDIAWHGRKVSGSAQRRGRRALLHHGTLLYDFDRRLMERYLKEPPRAPAYRAGRTHDAFVTNLPLPRATIETRLSGILRPPCGHKVATISVHNCATIGP